MVNINESLEGPIEKHCDKYKFIQEYIMYIKGKYQLSNTIEINVIKKFKENNKTHNDPDNKFIINKDKLKLFILPEISKNKVITSLNNLIVFRDATIVKSNINSKFNIKDEVAFISDMTSPTKIYKVIGKSQKLKGSWQYKIQNKSLPSDTQTNISEEELFSAEGDV